MDGVRPDRDRHVGRPRGPGAGLVDCQGPPGRPNNRPNRCFLGDFASRRGCRSTACR
jgi:hypothetical protein